jgi:hypothetical protein
MRSRHRAKEQTRLEGIVSGLSSAGLVDWLQTYINSAGVAALTYSQTAEVAALDVIEENLVALGVIVYELQSRRSDAFYPAPSPYLDDLVAKFSQRQGLTAPQRGL